MNALRIRSLFLSGSLTAIAAPVLIIMMLAMMVLPLPSFVLDVLFSFNIALSIVVLLTSLYTIKPLDFMVFPTVLLVSTMLRLSLNVASTRIVLTEGHTGPDAAGKVIEAFGHFLIGGKLYGWYRCVRDPDHHQFCVVTSVPKVQGGLQKLVHDSHWMPCRASRWRLTLI